MALLILWSPGYPIRAHQGHFHSDRRPKKWTTNEEVQEVWQQNKEVSKAYIN